MPEELNEIVKEYREKGIRLSDKEAENVYLFCVRKIEVAGIENHKEYLPVLYADEIRNHLFRRSVNATTILRQMEKEGLICVQCVGAAHA